MKFSIFKEQNIEEIKKIKPLEYSKRKTSKKKSEYYVAPLSPENQAFIDELKDDMIIRAEEREKAKKLRIQKELEIAREQKEIENQISRKVIEQIPIEVIEKTKPIFDVSSIVFPLDVVCKPWDRQKEIQKAIKVMNINDITLLIQSIQESRIQALVAMLYLTAARINEVLPMRKKDIEFINHENREIVLIHLLNEKNKKRTQKQIPLPINREESLLKIILDYIRNLKLDENLFNLKYDRAYFLIRKYTQLNPHYFRHLRCNHLSLYYNLNGLELEMFAGWSDQRPMQAYSESRWTDILRKL